MQTVIDFLKDWWPVLSPVVAEILVRLTPTSKSYSIVNGIKNVFDTLLPNNTKDGGVHK